MKRLLIFIFGISVIAMSWGKKSSEPDSYAYTRGVEACGENKYADAMDWFKKDLEQNPENGYAYLYVSAIYFYNEELGNALTAVERALKFLPKKNKEWRSMSYTNRSDIYAELGDTAKVISDLSQAISLNPENIDAYKKRAWIYTELDDYALSDKDYSKIIEIAPGNAEGYVGLGGNALAQKRWEDAVKQCSMAIQLASDCSKAYAYRALAYMRLEKWGEASDDIISAFKIDYNEAAFQLMLIFKDEALPILQSKLKVQMTKDPSASYWPYCLGALEESHDNHEEAISYYEKAFAIDSNSTLLKRISYCYMEMQELDKALEYVNQAMSLDPDNSGFIELKAEILGKDGRFDECITERDKYVAMYPDQPESYIYRGDNLMNARRFNEAIRDFNMAASLTNDYDKIATFLMRRGDAYRLSGNQEAAKKDYEKIIELEKDSVLKKESATPFAYSGLGNAEKAIETVKLVLANDTTDIPSILYNTACIYARVGLKEDAMKYLRQAVDKGYKDYWLFKQDYDMDPLRDMPEFQKLISEIDSKRASTSESKKNGDKDNEEVFRTETVEVPFTKESGVTKVKCSINGLPLHFVFDTGAAEVTMSMVEANFMLKNDYIKPKDIIGTSRYVDANGDISEGTVINLRSVNFGGLELDNVRASVVRNQKAPLLLGQSVLGRLGKIEIDNPGMKLRITHRVSK